MLLIYVGSLEFGNLKLWMNRIRKILSTAF